MATRSNLTILTARGARLADQCSCGKSIPQSMHCRLY